MQTVSDSLDPARDLPAAGKHPDRSERRSQKNLTYEARQTKQRFDLKTQVAVARPLRYGSFSMMGIKSATVLFVSVVLAGRVVAADTPHVVPKVNPLPVALSSDFQFRKTKLFFLSETPPKSRKSVISSAQNTGIAEASMNFERTYRMYGAITAADQRQRFGNYFDFFWRTKRPANVTIRLEYRQEKLRSFVQARELAYHNVKGNRRTEFAIIGDDYLNDGRVTSWRCLLIENGHIVAETHSYLWE